MPPVTATVVLLRFDAITSDGGAMIENSGRAAEHFGQR
jgi:hypothetical protein